MQTRRFTAPSVQVFASGIICMGILGLVYADFAMQWQPVPAGFAGRQVLAYVAATLSLLAGAGLLFSRTASLSARILLPYLVAWQLLKVPALCVAPGMEAVWLGFGEIAVLLAGGIAVFAVLAAKPGPRVTFLSGRRGLDIARVLFGLALLPIGLSHLVYVQITISLVPAWMPLREGWAILTGIGQIACGLGLLVNLRPRLWATLESTMLTGFALLVWVPAVLAKPTERLPWTALLITWAIAASAWFMAGSLDRAAARDREAGIQEVSLSGSNSLAGESPDR